MIKILVEKLPRITKSRLRLERDLDVKIINRGREISIKGTPEDEYTAEKVLEALDFGFEYKIAILIKEEDFMFEILNIKEHTGKKNLERVRGRIIGKDGRTKNTIMNLTKCAIEIRENQIGIIGPPENLQNAQEGIIAIAKGAKQSNVYAHLEKNQVKYVEDLGLKE